MIRNKIGVYQPTKRAIKLQVVEANKEDDKINYWAVAEEVVAKLDQKIEDDWEAF